MLWNFRPEVEKQLVELEQEGYKMVENCFKIYINGFSSNPNGLLEGTWTIGWKNKFEVTNNSKYSECIKGNISLNTITRVE